MHPGSVREKVPPCRVLSAKLHRMLRLCVIMELWGSIHFTGCAEYKRYVYLDQSQGGWVDWQSLESTKGCSVSLKEGRTPTNGGKLPPEELRGVFLTKGPSSIQCHPMRAADLVSLSQVLRWQFRLTMCQMMKLQLP